jgi:ElaB/YqjD/DUF883 family membrane-anchored ribosome-binding protein
METKAGNGPEVNWDKFLEDLRALVNDGEQLLKVRVGRAREQAAARMETAGRVVRERPYQSLAVGLGLGIVAGLLLHRWFSSESSESKD